MFNVQCAFLIATGILCGLHDCIENDSAPLYEEIKVAFEQALCLLGSANAQLSILGRQRVLAAINRSRINLAELPLPNAKSWLFGDDFPSLASKQAELSRGLTKNLTQTTGKSFSRRSNSSQSQSRHRRDCGCSRVFPKVPSLLLEGNMLPIQSSSIRPVFSPQNFCESSKTCCRIPEEEGHSSPYLPGRLSSFGFYNGGSCQKYSAGSDSPSVPRFQNKPQEIITDFNPMITSPDFQIDSMCMMISLPAKKANKILDCCRRVLVAKSIKLRNLAS